MTPVGVGLKGAVVAIVGRLTTLGRAEAGRLVREAGGRLAEGLDAGTDLVVLGHGELPLSADGVPDAAAQLVRGLTGGGHPARVLTELDFLGLLGLSELAEELGRLYTTEQLGRLLSLPVERIRGWIRSGLIRPVRVLKRLAWFDFREVMAARALARLVDSGVPVQRIRKSLEEIGTWLPGAPTLLVQLEALTPESLRLRLPGGGVASPSGQLLFEFREGGPPATATGRAHLRIFDPRALDTGLSAAAGAGGDGAADHWFRAGLEAEDRADLEASEQAYQRSLEAGGPNPETMFNLGNVRYRRGRHVEAAQIFLEALELDPEYVECWNNLGNTFAALKRGEDAVRSYRRALEIEPRYAEAHANLAQALEERGRPTEARIHWTMYLGAEPGGERAARVRRMLGIVHGRGEDA